MPARSKLLEAFGVCGYRSGVLNIGVGMQQLFEINNEICLVQYNACFEFNERMPNVRIYDVANVEKRRNL